MRRHILTIAFILVFAASLLGWPLSAFSAVSFSADTTISLSGSGISFTVVSGSAVDQMVVYSTYVDFTMSAASSLVIRSTERKLFSNDLAKETDCTNSTYSQLSIGAQATSTEITVTPQTSTCGEPGTGSSPSGGSGGGSVSAPAPQPTTPTTTTGQVTTTASEGGKTTLTTSEKSTASVELPANAVSSSTEVKINSEAQANVVVSRPVPSGKNVVGGYVYNYSATSGGQAVTTFSKNITLTFTYQDSQIIGLNENTLKVYYWDGKQWVSLTSTVDKANNKITAVTTHFSYFVIMGENQETPATLAKPEDYGLKEGDLIRAQGDFDIFIINQYGYKRLFLNPAIFEMYGHLGTWKDVKIVTLETRDAFITSSHYRYVNEEKVYSLEVTGEDTGILHWIDMTSADFLAQGGKANAIFTINQSEFNWYPKGADKTSL